MARKELNSMNKEKAKNKLLKQSNMDEKHNKKDLFNIVSGLLHPDEKTMKVLDHKDKVQPASYFSAYFNNNIIYMRSEIDEEFPI